MSTNGPAETRRRGLPPFAWIPLGLPLSITLLGIAPILIVRDFAFRELAETFTYSALPQYALFVLVFVALARGRSERVVKGMALVSPLVFAPLYTWSCIAVRNMFPHDMVEDRSGWFDTFGILFAVILGYGCVAIGFLIGWLRDRFARGRQSPPSAASHR